MIKSCKHSWKIGARIGSVVKHKVEEVGLYIYCSKCKKIIQAYYNDSWKEAKNDMAF
jgi:hypothetical protein